MSQSIQAPFRLIRIENLSTGASYNLDGQSSLPAECVKEGENVRLECPQGYIAGCWQGGRLASITSWLWNSLAATCGFRPALEGQLRNVLLSSF